MTNLPGKGLTQHPAHNSHWTQADSLPLPISFLFSQVLGPWVLSAGRFKLLSSRGRHGLLLPSDQQRAHMPFKNSTDAPSRD